jgi:pimeloyl-ACP methyl ester carboxylesterase
MTRRTTIKTGIAIGAAAVAGRPERTVAAAAAPGNPLTPVPVPTQAPAKEAVAVLGGARIGYWDTEGSGQTVVLVHPATGSARIWVYQQPAFARAGYRVIAFSRRGYANSDPVPKTNAGSASIDLHNLIESLRIQKFHIVGSAAGGQISIDYALSHPERLHSLTLACAVGGVADKEYTDMAARIRPPGYADMPAEFRELSPSYRAMNPEGAKAWAGLEHGAITGNRFGQMNVNTITLASLGGLKVPTLVIGGDADLGAPPPMLRMYAARIPGSELRIVPEGGHSLYWERPDVFNTALLDFFKRHSS